MQMAEASPRSARLHWLDVGGALLSEGGGELPPELRFDGPHMAPPFVRDVGAALEGLLQRGGVPSPRRARLERVGEGLHRDELVRPRPVRPVLLQACA